MIKLVGSASDKLLRLIAPKAVAEASSCNCAGIDTWYQYCGCIGGYVYQRLVRCDGCNLHYGTCSNTAIRC